MQSDSLRLERMGHLSLRVSDLDASEKFYIEILGMRPVWRSEGEIAFLECGNDDLALIQIPKEEVQAFRQRAQSSQSLHHFGFRVRSKDGVDQLAEEVKARGIIIDDGPRDHRDGSRSFYFRDPDGNYVQILWDPIRETPTS
ncbi:MAG: glyoxalase/bleomycin resistance protein/dioxygenase [candidate division NC10 bacterium]|nr:glyoxalase/bleomycin resistance protein/dioxygenase [candidate division NC10 bacterium]